MKKFTHFPNHGDEEGRNCFTVCYGEPNGDEVIISAEDKEKDAKEVVKRLNGILKEALIDNERVHIYQIESNIFDVEERLPKDMEKALRCEIRAHKDRIKEVKDFFSVKKPKRK